MSANHLEPNDLIRVRGGAFLMGQADGRDEERPVHRVTVAPFLFARFQVTNSHWEQFRKAAGRDPQPFTHETGPVTHVNWFDAVAFCRWLSKEWSMPVRLPSEAEWEFAARGGVEQTIYPWGNEPRQYPAGRWDGGPEPVGETAPNPFGLYDMCENVHEWCSDWFDPQYYAASPEDNPRGPADGKRRSSRGGAWRHHIRFSRCAARSSIPPEFRYADYGFRVAADA